MRRLLPLAPVLALALAACSRAPETPAAGGSTPPPPAPPVASDLTPEGMAKAADVPMYPGALAPDGLSSAPRRGQDGTTHYTLVLATEDSPQKAAAWYASALKLKAVPGMGGVSILGKSKKGNDLMITIGPEAGRTLIRIRSIAYKTP